MNSFTVKCDGRTVKINSSDILYIKAENKDCLIVLNGRSLHCPKTLSAVLSGLSEEMFFRVHRSYAVNLNRIAKLRKHDIIMENGDTIPVSRHTYTEFIYHFSEFFKNSYTHF